MNKTLSNQITNLIEYIFDIGGTSLSKKIIIYPCGDVGIQVINVMKLIYSIEPAYIIDNHKCKYSSNIHNISFLNNIDTNEYAIIIASTNKAIYSDLKKM